MNFAAIFARLGQDVSMRRYPAPTMVKGRHTRGAPVESTIRAVITPATGDDLQLLPEGERVSSAITVLTPEALEQPDAANGSGDQVQHGGDWYAIRHLEDWQGAAGYSKAIAVRVQS